MNHGQSIVAHVAALDLCEALYRATAQTEGSEARNSNIAIAKEKTARIAELLGCTDLAEEIRKAA